MAYSAVANSPYEDVRLPNAIAPSWSLLSVASPLPALDTAVATAPDGLPQSLGFQLDQTGCVTVAGIKNCVTDTTKMTPGTNGPTYPFAPFWLYSSMECDYSPTPGDRLFDIARTDLEAGTAYGVSKQLQTGTINAGTTSQSPSLVTTATVVSNTAIDLDVALGLLLADWYANVSHAAPAVLHMPPAFLPFALRHGIVSRTAGGQALEVMPGLGVSIGPGYDNTPPTGTTPPANTSYVYLTGPVYVALGSIQNAADPARTGESMDDLNDFDLRRQNKTIVFARRRALAMFDTCSVRAIAAKLPT